MDGTIKVRDDRSIYIAVPSGNALDADGNASRMVLFYRVGTTYMDVVDGAPAYDMNNTWGEYRTADGRSTIKHGPDRIVRLWNGAKTTPSFTETVPAPRPKVREGVLLAWRVANGGRWEKFNRRTKAWEYVPDGKPAK